MPTGGTLAATNRQHRLVVKLRRQLLDALSHEASAVRSSSHAGCAGMLSALKLQLGRLMRISVDLPSSSKTMLLMSAWLAHHELELLASLLLVVLPEARASMSVTD